MSHKSRWCRSIRISFYVSFYKIHVLDMRSCVFPELWEKWNAVIHWETGGLQPLIRIAAIDSVVSFPYLFGLSSLLVLHLLYKGSSGLSSLFNTLEVTYGLFCHSFFLSLKSTGNTVSCWDMVHNILVNKCVWSTHWGLAVTIPKGATLPHSRSAIDALDLCAL